MKVVITGGAGFIGSRLARTLLDRGQLANPAGMQTDISELVVFDIAEPATLPDDSRLRVVVGEATDSNLLADVLHGAESVFHFASVVSGGAEADLQLGLRVNLDGTRLLLDLLADGGKKPRLVFSSSLAVYSDGSGEVNDLTVPTPKSSYGVQKLCCELLIGDYSRRGLLDGRSMRFPTIAVRPGKANLANSSFISNIIREPVMGRETVCPVPEDTDITLMSPGRLIEAIIKVHDLDAAAMGWPKALLLPAVRVSVTQMLDALEAQVGKAARDKVSFATDQKVLEMVNTWPVEIRADRATALGIETDADAADIVADFVKENAR